LSILAFGGIRDFRETLDEPDDFFEVDHKNLYITVIGLILLLGFAALTLGLYILLA